MECHSSSGSRLRRLPGPQRGAKPRCSQPPPAAGAPATAAGRDTRRLAGQLGDNGPAVPARLEAYREGGARPRVTALGGGWGEAARKRPEQWDPVMGAAVRSLHRSREQTPVISSLFSPQGALQAPQKAQATGEERCRARLLHTDGITSEGLVSVEGKGREEGKMSEI